MSLKTALLVDDSKLARVTLKRLLERKGLDVTPCESGADALDFLENQKVDVIFMDHLMPEMDGIETIAKIKAKPELAAIPVVICSGKEGADYSLTVKQAGAVGYLAKPPEQSQLDALLEMLAQEVVASPATSEQPTEVSTGTSTELPQELPTAVVTETPVSAAPAMGEAEIAALVEQKISALQASFRSEIDSALENRIQQSVEAMITTRLEQMLPERVHSVVSRDIPQMLSDALASRSEEMENQLMSRLSAEVDVRIASSLEQQSGLGEEAVRNIVQQQFETLADDSAKEQEQDQNQAQLQEMERTLSANLGAELSEKLTDQLMSSQGQFRTELDGRLEQQIQTVRQQLQQNVAELIEDHIKNAVAEPSQSQEPELITDINARLEALESNPVGDALSELKREWQEQLDRVRNDIQADVNDRVAELSADVGSRLETVENIANRAETALAESDRRTDDLEAGEQSVDDEEVTALEEILTDMISTQAAMQQQLKQSKRNGVLGMLVIGVIALASIAMNLGWY